MCYLLYSFIELIKFKFHNMNVNFVEIKLWSLFIELVIQAYHSMYNIYECLLFVESILCYRGNFLNLTFN